jgi:hypothetical protein
MFALSPEGEMLRDSLSELARNEFADDAFTWAGEVPWPNVDLLASS